jgi:hypothetical protein
VDQGRKMVSVPLPLKVEGDQLIGSGWKVILNQGWKVVDGDRKGDKRLVRAEPASGQNDDGSAIEKG